MLHDVLAEAVEHSAAPAAVRLGLTQLFEADGDLRSRLTEDEDLRGAVVAVLGASRFLTRLLLADRAALAVLADLDHRPEGPPHDAAALARWKRLELLRIAARDLTGLDELDAVGAALTRLAVDVLRVATELAPDTASLAVIGMGKLGAGELNYASDVDVLFVGNGDARTVVEIARRCFRVDADLRPEGRDGPLVRSLASYEAYWDRWADTWEFQALLKACPVAGNAELGDAFVEAARTRIWTRPFGADELREVRTMKSRAEAEVARRGLSEREVKRGRGGIRDIEFAVQLLQLVHGRADPALRRRGTIEALRELAAAGYVGADDAAALVSAYRFLRAVEHRLQLVEDQQVHAVPRDAAARTQLARTLGFRDVAGRTALARFEEELRRHQATVRRIHERLFFRPLLEVFAGTSAMPASAAETRLAAFGFRDAARTRQALAELTRGLTRSSRLMHQMLPLLLEWLSETPDPDLGLLGLRTLVARQHRAARLVSTFRDFPEAARRLCVLVGTSRLLLTAIERNPDFILDLTDDARLAHHGRSELVERAFAALRWRGDAAQQRAALLRLQRLEMLRTAARDVLGLDGPDGTGRALTDLAEAVLEAALTIVDPQVPMAVMAMGRFGGRELSYASDLDVLLVYRGESAADAAAADAAASALLRFVKGVTPAERIFLLDADLRPEGRQGPLARSVDGYRSYYQRWALTWERQALLRCRHVAGDRTAAEELLAAVEEFVWARPFEESDAREVRRMKARIERERIPTGEDPEFHLKLGRGSLSDVEWTVQLLQLRSGVRATGTAEALDRLRDAGVIGPDDAGVLADAYAFCERTRNRWFLVKGAPGDALPPQRDQLDRLARSLDTTGVALRDEYRRVTRRARQVVERLFYGAR